MLELDPNRHKGGSGDKQAEALSGGEAGQIPAGAVGHEAQDDSATLGKRRGWSSPDRQLRGWHGVLGSTSRAFAPRNLQSNDWPGESQLSNFLFLDVLLKNGFLLAPVAVNRSPLL